MVNRTIWSFGFFVVMALSAPVAAQSGWSRDAGIDYGATWSSQSSNSSVLVLLLWEIDQKTGSRLLELQDTASGEVMERALAAMPFKVEQIVESDYSSTRNPKLTGYADTPRGRMAFAATLSNRGVSRRLVVLFDEPAKLEGLQRRVGTVSNFGSRIAAADRPGWVPGRSATQPSRYPVAANQPSRTAAAPPTAQRSSAPQPRGKYELPTDQSDFYDWPRTGPVTYSPNIKDPLAPRGYVGKTGPKFNVSTFDGAFEKLLEYTDIKLAGRPTIRRLQAWTDYDQREARLLMVPTTRAGIKGVLMVYLVSLKGSPEFSVLAYEVPEQTFLDGGGIIRMMMIRGLIPSPDVFPKEQRKRIARSPFKQQTDLYDAALTSMYEKRKRQFVSSQSAVTLRMMELNYDLLLGGDITSPFIGD